MKTGVVIGKFYPPHRGHKLLIDTASAASDLTVIICEHPSQEIAGALRQAWLQEIHPSVRVVVTPDDLPDEPGPWAARTVEILGRRPDLVFTSEDYGPGYAAAMGAEHVFVDPDRLRVPISATRIRQSPLDHLEFLEPCVRAHFVKRIVAIGVESSGTTTLAEALAKTFQTEWVPEYGREYSLAKTDEWRTDDFITVATTQQQREDAAARRANKVLICDTDALATTIWHRRYVGHDSPEVNEIGYRSRPDLYLLTMPDFGFVQDGTRDGEHIRMEMHEWFVERLESRGIPFIRLGGPHEARMSAALAETERRFGLKPPSTKG
ncbi:MAG: AAA family ATPase [Armatimonadetes bacterium]|nr:AAA family ATPase [Armatimonadota bacterium]